MQKRNLRRIAVVAGAALISGVATVPAMAVFNVGGPIPLSETDISKDLFSGLLPGGILLTNPNTGLLPNGVPAAITGSSGIVSNTSAAPARPPSVTAASPPSAPSLWPPSASRPPCFPRRSVWRTRFSPSTDRPRTAAL